MSIPQEIISEVILPTLPVKSLLRFTSVCKSWRSTISTPHFEKLHSEKKNNPISHKIILKGEFLHFVDYEGAKEAVDLRLHLKGRLCSFVGICNGLTCFILSRGEVVIFNPATRRSLTIREKGLDFGNCYGLGYDSLRNDYKLVTFDHKASSTEGIHVYSLRSNNWERAKECFSFDVARIQTCAVYANGYLHWLAETMPGSENYCTTIIITFNIAAETLGQLDIPEVDGEFNFTWLQFGFSGEYIYLLYHYLVNDGFQGWMMMEYGAAQSWTKFGIVFPSPLENLECRFMKEVFLLKGGEFIIVLQTRRGVVALINGKEEFTNPIIRNKFEILDVVPYVESLVGLNCRQMKRIEDHSRTE